MKIWSSLLLTIWVICAYAGPPLDHSKVGVYGTLFDFCDYSVYKFQYKDQTQFAKSLPHWQQMLAETTAQNKLNLVLLYTFDRVKHSRPLEEYLRNTDTVLRALDLKTVYALCLGEENVTWNNGLQVLNALYDHIKTNYCVPVFQWLTMPDLPHPKLRADGWIIDPYGFDRSRFRRYLQKYLATGKPVINCIWASPAHNNFTFDHTPQEQVDVCREFNVPMFFYCVDTKWGSPAVWLRSDDPVIVALRQWLMDVVNRVHLEGARGLPLDSANFSPGRPIEVSGDERGLYEYNESFATEDFLDDATIRGFLGLRWDGQKETLTCDPIKARLPVVELLYHFTSPFRMSHVKAELEGASEGPGATSIRLGLSDNGHQWKYESGASAPCRFILNAELPATFSGHDFWLRVTVGTPVALDCLRVTCRTALPERREVRLESDATGRVLYVEDFASRKYLHLAEITGGETLYWQRGCIFTHGIKGRVNLVVLKWRFFSERPLSELRVRVEGAANGVYLGASNTVGLSLDGKSLLVTDTTTGKPVSPCAQGWYKEALTLDGATCPQLTNIYEFYLHVLLVNKSCVLTSTSNRITKLTVSAKAK